MDGDDESEIMFDNEVEGGFWLANHEVCENENNGCKMANACQQDIQPLRNQLCLIILREKFTADFMLKLGIVC